jgi:hypothetical protein
MPPASSVSRNAEYGRKHQAETVKLKAVDGETCLPQLILLPPRETLPGEHVGQNCGQFMAPTTKDYVRTLYVSLGD